MTDFHPCPIWRWLVQPCLLLGALGAVSLALLGTAPASRAGPAPAVCSAATTASAGAPAAAPAAIQITVEKVRNSKGLITAVLYADDPENFLKKGARLDRIRVEAREGETLLCLNAPSSGRYSIAIYHDENGNKKFDRDFLGLPTEGYGFSQNPGFRFGKPDLEDTLFTTDDGLTTLKISVLYLQG